MVQVHAKMVKSELHKISSVPREFGGDTKFTEVVGLEHSGSNTVYASTAASKQKRTSR